MLFKVCNEGISRIRLFIDFEKFRLCLSIELLKHFQRHIFAKLRSFRYNERVTRFLTKLRNINPEACVLNYRVRLKRIWLISGEHFI